MHVEIIAGSQLLDLESVKFQLNNIGKLPTEISECIDSDSFHDDPDSFHHLGTGRLGNHIYSVNTRNGQAAILKIGTGLSATDIDNEADRLRWLHGRCKAPFLLAHTMGKETSWSLQSFVGIVAGHACIGELSGLTIIEAFAESLREIHRTGISGCPFVSALELELNESERRLKSGLIAENDFIKEVGERPSRVFDYLVNSRGIIKEDCFTHGDYSLPNILFNESGLFNGGIDCFKGEVSGVVDWGLASVADPHRDFMSVELTIARNMDRNYIRSFYEIYGIDTVDNERIRYYWLLDRFEAHLLPSR